jgi:ribosome-binding factor A
MQAKRLERVNQLMKEEISRLVQRELKDPRLGFVTVTEVDTTADLKQAKVFVSVLGDDEQWVKSFKALESARGFIWAWLRRHLDLRVTPDLSFRPDHSMEHAARMQTLLAGLRPGPAAGGAEAADRDDRAR